MEQPCQDLWVDFRGASNRTSKRRTDAALIFGEQRHKLLFETLLWLDVAILLAIRGIHVPEVENAHAFLCNISEVPHVYVIF